jgi:hypothetical protein
MRHTSLSKSGGRTVLFGLMGNVGTSSDQSGKLKENIGRLTLWMTTLHFLCVDLSYFSSIELKIMPIGLGFYSRLATLRPNAGTLLIVYCVGHEMMSCRHT